MEPLGGPTRADEGGHSTFRLGDVAIPDPLGQAEASVLWTVSDPIAHRGEGE
jgi:hypothetical protein